MEYWGEPELIICDNSYICSSTGSDLVLLVCMALLPQITCRHYSKFSVVPLSI